MDKLSDKEVFERLEHLQKMLNETIAEVQNRMAANAENIREAAHDGK